MSESEQKVAVVMLAGGPKPRMICDQVGMSLWDLPLQEDLDVGGAWSQVIQEAGFEQLCQDLLVSASTSNVSSRVSTESLWNLQVETRAHRGTAGSIADWCLARKLDRRNAEWILLIEGSASPAVDLSPFLPNIRGNCEFDAILGVSELDRHCGCMLVRRSSFERVPTLGFFDLKEQLLPVIRESGGRIGAEVIAERAVRISDQLSWLQTLALWRSTRRGRDPESPFASSDLKESLVMPSATVEGAEIIHSIILDGAVIEPGAVIARSVVAPGVRVSANTIVSDVVLGIDRKSRVRRKRYGVGQKEIWR